MIRFNLKEPALAELTSGLNELPLVAQIEGARDLHIYSVAKNRETDLAIPAEFPEWKHFTDLMNEKGFSARRDCYWGLAPSFNFNVLGIGFDFKRNHPEQARKAILCAYLLLNKRVKLS